MPKSSETPDTLKPYTHHGLKFEYAPGDKNALATCPWCNRERKFSVRLDNGLWRCFVCNEGNDNGKPIQGGNALVFIRKLHDESFKTTPYSEYLALAEDRRLASPDTLVRWGAAKSTITGLWLLPAYDPTGKLANLYDYRRDNKTGRSRMLPTPTLGHKIFAASVANHQAVNVFWCEGPWDGMAWEETLAGVRPDGRSFAVASDPAQSLLATSLVLSVPGCGTFFEEWCILSAGKRVFLCYDNDHPRTNPRTGAAIPPGGLSGMERAAYVLSHSPTPPTDIMYMKWGGDGYNLELPDGYDLRDAVNT